MLGRLLGISLWILGRRTSKGKASASSSVSNLGYEADARRRPLLNTSSRMSPPRRRSYGATDIHDDEYNFAAGSRTESPETYRRNSSLAKVPEEDVDNAEDVANAFLEEKGLYIGSYRRLVLAYTSVPISCALLWLLLAFLPPLIWHTPLFTDPSQPRTFRTPLPELLTAPALWALSHLLSEPLFTLFSLLAPPAPASVLATAAHVLLRNALRLAALPILQLRHHMDWPQPTYRDAVFWRVVWLALGWSLAEVAVGVAQGYAQIALYRGALISEAELAALLEAPAHANGAPGRRVGARSADHSPVAVFAQAASPSRGSVYDGDVPEELGLRRSASRIPSEAELKLEVEKDLDQLLLLKTREELEELYGVPAIDIPVFISCLLRIASIFLSLGFLLVLSAAYLSAPISLSASRPIAAPFATPAARPYLIPLYSTNRAFYITFVLVCALHFFLSVLHTPALLPRVGLHVVAYLGFLVGLGTVFAGLGLWDALS